MEIIGSGHKKGEDTGSRLFIELVKREFSCVTHFDRLFQKDDIAVGSGEYTPTQLAIQLLDLIKIRSREGTYKCISIPCHSASSCIMNDLLRNRFKIYNIAIYEPISSVCRYIINTNNIRNVLVLCTPLTAQLLWHKKILEKYHIECRYITFPILAKTIDNRGDYEKGLEPLRSVSCKMRTFIQKKCDVVVCGCTHYNEVMDLIKNILRGYNYRGCILDSNELVKDDIKNDNIYI